jgi:fluoroquinolone resistance protein
MANQNLLQGATEYDNETFGRDTAIPERLERADFMDCEFVGCRWGSARLLSCRFIDCRFERVDMAAADLTDCTLRGVSFHDCRLVGINWTILRGLQSCTWQRSLLDDGCFQALELAGMEWLECQLKQVDFSDCDLRRAKFHDSRLEGATVNGARLAQADFTGVGDLSIHPQYVKLDKTIVEMEVVLRMASALGLKIAGQ